MLITSYRLPNQIKNGLIIITLCMIIMTCNEKKVSNQKEIIDSTTLVFTDPANGKLIKDEMVDSFYRYRYRAFDKIEFGTHKNFRDEYFSLLNLDFRFGGTSDYYFGLYSFILRGIDNIQYQESALNYLQEISIIIDKKYSSSQTINRKVAKGPDPLLLLDCKVIMSPDDFDPTSIPRDAGTNFIYKRWTEKEIAIELGYMIDYSCKLDKDTSEKKLIFDRRYELYINFESPYLTRLISDRNKAERNKAITQETSKF